MDTPVTPSSNNVPEFSVGEISGAVKRTLEAAFARVRVRGEITELRAYRSGHIYFALKDEDAKLRAVAWKGTVPRLGLRPEDGLEVIATGKVSSYPGRSDYQLVVDRLEYAGAGAMLARIERLRLKLSGEGLFGDERKRPLPLLPDVVGVVTSPSGAVLHDIATTIARRFPRPVLLWPVPVQGEGAAERIAAAIRAMGRLPATGPLRRPDVLIVGRGGGSLEDLMAFNDEAVVRAAAASPIPLISAVGHETDTTLLDFAADRRAPTPTAAAEMAVPSRAELAATVAGEGARLVAGLRRAAQERHLRLSRAQRGLPDLPTLIAAARHRLDDRALRLGLALPNFLETRRVRLGRAERALPDPRALVATARGVALGRGARLEVSLLAYMNKRRDALVQADAALPSPRALMDRRRNLAIRTLARLTIAPVQSAARERRAVLAGLGAQLESVSPLAVLARGYVLVTDAAGQPVTRAAGVRGGKRLRLRFGDGEVGAVANEIRASKEP
jgi:exodeoxyribonuclease VII large subunit